MLDKVKSIKIPMQDAFHGLMGEMSIFLFRIIIRFLFLFFNNAEKNIIIIIFEFASSMSFYITKIYFDN